MGCRFHLKLLEHLPGYCNIVIGDMLSEIAHLDERIKLDAKLIAKLGRDDAQSRRLIQLCGPHNCYRHHSQHRQRT